MKRILGYRVFILAGLLFFSSVVITIPVLRGIEKGIDTESKTLTLLISSVISRSQAHESAFEEVKGIIGDLNFPVIMTNEMGLPIAWASVDVPSSKYTLTELYRPDLLKDDPDYLKLISYMGKLAEEHDPYEIKRGTEVVGYIYYGYPQYTSFLRRLPFFILIFSFIAFLFMIQAARVIHTYEVETIWANFARGLAHQMGTPVSALMGWMELLKAGKVNEQVLLAMEKDISRLGSILQRFSRVGGEVRKEDVEICSLLTNLLAELRERFLKGVFVTLECAGDLTVTGDKELLSWAFENLLRNSYEALGPNGHIVVEPKREGKEVVILFKDNGKGIDSKVKKKIFRESFSTKEHGWGIGLLLVRRIVQEFHGGKVRFIKSEPYVETIFEVRLSEKSDH
ncbi:MAG: HAMP domain-containing sensor histidine kinase [Candidatus Hydrothermia bacterium]|nr:HAMP domain-containing histidine kinase [Candidatus Hydrothermae bacterium]MDD5572582.1 HAMP domain-containing sensor histidine kinase [Candidatus Hydrothermia bacterium]